MAFSYNGFSFYAFLLEQYARFRRTFDNEQFHGHEETLLAQ